MRKKDPYPTLLGIDWAFENYTVIDPKWKTIIFEVDKVQFIQLLDPYQGLMFTELVDDREEPNLLDLMYHLTIGKIEYYINPTTYGSTLWRSIQSTKTGSSIALDGDHELHSKEYANVCCACQTGTKV